MIDLIDETGSTNADLLQRAKSGEALIEGDWLVARRQLAGRGRQGRNWFDGAGNFMGSTIVRRTQRDPPAHTLALMAGLAVYEALLPFCPNPASLSLKWPNDLLLNRAKLCGILLENANDIIVVGVGVNLNKAPQIEGRETIALSDVGKPPNLETFAERLALSFDAELERWRHYGLEPLLRRWQIAAHPIGTAIKVHDSSGDQLKGKFGGLSPQGALLLRQDGGQTITIHAGDIMLD